MQVEALKKQKAKKASGDSSKKADKPKDAPAPSASAAPEQEEDTIKDDADKDKPSDVVEQTVTSPSLSEAEQSRARSTSFRKQSISSGVAGAAPPTPGLTSPDLRETAPDIYRKNMARIEELEKENKRLARESTEAEKRWQKAEEELADLREAEGDSGKKAGGSDEVEKLVSHIGGGPGRWSPPATVSIHLASITQLMQYVLDRNLRSPRYKGKMPNSKPAATGPSHPSHTPPSRRNWPNSSLHARRRSRRWSWRCRGYGLRSSAWRPTPLSRSR